MKYDVIISKRAEEMLLVHVRFLARVSVPAAKVLRNGFKDLLESLSSNPFQFQEEVDLNLPKGKYRRAVLLRRYKILFSVKGSKVYVDAIGDCRQSALH